jgi:Nucleotidyltransferase of unknown function (DUF6036)
VRRFDRAELVSFIRAVDRHLSDKVEILVIGGAAAALGYSAGVHTADVDVFELRHGSAKALAHAAEAARQETGLAVSVGAAAVASLPDEFESRVRSVRGLQLKKLSILIPDKYDIALSKTVRGYPHDIDAIEGIHAHHRLSPRTLVARFESELMKTAVADPRKLALNMAMVAARLYGFEKGRRLAEKWGVPIPAR